MINLEIVRRKNSLSNRKSPGAERSGCNSANDWIMRGNSR